MNNIQIITYVCIFVYVVWVVVLVKKAIKISNCAHRNTFVYVENVAATCETTTITCMDCGKKTTKTDC